VTHVVLLGDSIFDNGAYTNGGPDVITQLRGILPRDWRATLLAVDGHRTEDVTDQVARLQPDTSHLVLSVGGNDVLAYSNILDQRTTSSAGLLGLLADAQAGFERRYRAVTEVLTRHGLPLAVCTIYNGQFPDRDFQRLASTALCVFNDVIIRVAFERGLTVIDLRVICDQAEDYANPIEPSSLGGAKIAAAVLRAVTGAAGPSVVVLTGREGFPGTSGGD
jgi:hypothetical protein